MVNAAPAKTIRRRRHRSMFTVSANGVVLGKGLLDLVELALVILGERHDPFSSAPGWGDFSYGTVRRALPRLVAVDIPLRHPASRVTSKVSGAVPTRTSAGRRVHQGAG